MILSSFLALPILAPCGTVTISVRNVPRLPCGGRFHADF